MEFPTNSNIKHFRVHKQKIAILWSAVVKTAQVGDPLYKPWFKVRTFWKGHKNLKQSPARFDVYLVTVKSSGWLFQIIVAFSECPNFKWPKLFILDNLFLANIFLIWQHCFISRQRFYCFNRNLPAQLFSRKQMKYVLWNLLQILKSSRAIFCIITY